jgi:hypothetical protein
MNSKAIIMSGLMTLQSLNAIAAPVKIDIQDFNNPKAEYVKSGAEISTNNNVLTEEEVFLTNINTDIKIERSQILSEEISGVYKNPFGEADVMVVSFQENENLENEHKKIEKVLLDNKILVEEYYNKLKDYENESMKYEMGSFHKSNTGDKVDYNFVSLSTSQIKMYQKQALDSGFGKDVVDLIPSMVFLHEASHSHNNQSKIFIDYKKEIESKYTKEELMYKSYDLSMKIEKDIKNIALYRENHADSLMLLTLAQEKKQNGYNNLSDIHNLSEYMQTVFRKDDIVKNRFNTHLSKTTIKTTMDFIEKNSESLKYLSQEELEEIANNITRESLNHLDVEVHTSTLKGQMESAKNGGIAKEVVQKVSNSINDKIEIVINQKGSNVIKFDKEGNENQYKSKESFKV